MTENYRPPRHHMVHVGTGGIEIIGALGTEYFKLAPDSAITLGLALMETGLYLKSQRTAALKHSPVATGATSGGSIKRPTEE